jgi:hypothetical protein
MARQQALRFVQMLGQPVELRVGCRIQFFRASFVVTRL